MSRISKARDFDQAAGVCETVWLLGQPSLNDYIHFVRDQTVSGRNLKRSDLVNEWRTANDYYYELEQIEAGIADEISIRDLDAATTPIADELMASPRFQRSYDAVPTTIAMVELDRLIVSQSHIDITHCAQQQARLGKKASGEKLLRFCQGLDREDPPVKIQRTGRSRFTFTSPSSDFRFHEPVALTPDLIAGIASVRGGSTALALTLGYSSNYLNVIRSENRMVIYNGHHRAYTLRALGYTHAPCIVQTVTRRDELNLIASGNLTDTPEFYFRNARPPLLKDYFDSRIRKVFHLPRINHVIEVSFEVREFEVAD